MSAEVELSLSPGRHVAPSRSEGGERSGPLYVLGFPQVQLLRHL